MHDLAALLEHGHLVLSDRYAGRAEGGDVGRLADRIAEKADRNARLKTAHLNLGLYGRIALHAGNRDEVHVVERQLSQLGHHGLNEDVDLFRVETAGQIVERDLHDVLTDLLRVLGVVGQRLRVRDHNIDLIELARILKPDALAQRADVVADVQTAGRTVAGKNDLFHWYISLFRDAMPGFQPFPRHLIYMGGFYRIIE